MHNMIGQWVPPNERSKFVTACIGSAVGFALFYPIFGFIMSITSWEYVFHTSGLVGLIWFIFWMTNAYDTPALHPRIHPDERRYIEDALSNKGQSNKNVSTQHCDNSIFLYFIF